MKTYAEQRGNIPFDWSQFLMRDDYTETELKDACVDAVSWITCACGNQCKDIHRYENGQPTDNELSIRGCEFAGAIFSLKSAHGNKNLTISVQKVAREILRRIEARSAYLLGVWRSKQDFTEEEKEVLFQMYATQEEEALTAVEIDQLHEERGEARVYLNSKTHEESSRG